MAGGRIEQADPGGRRADAPSTRGAGRRCARGSTPGRGRSRASARTAARTNPITPAATGPRPVTSPTDSRIAPWGRTTTSYQSPPTEIPASPARMTPLNRQPAIRGSRSGWSDACSVSATRCSCPKRCERVNASAPNRDTVDSSARSRVSSRRGRSNASAIAPCTGSFPRTNGAATAAATPVSKAVSAQSGNRARSSSASAAETSSPVRIASACGWAAWIGTSITESGRRPAGSRSKMRSVLRSMSWTDARTAQTSSTTAP